MASKILKGLTIEIGGDTTKLSKALDDVEKKGGSLSKELGEINKLLKLDPTNTELLAQKQKVLADAVDNTEDKLKTLKEAEKQVQKQFEKGEASEEQVRALQREIIATEKKLNSYKSAAKQTAEAVERVGDNSDKAAADVEDLGDSSEKAEQETEELGSSLDGTLSGALKGVAALAAAASAAIIGTVEATQEYRTAMGKLDVAYQSANHSSEAAKKTYKELQSILGDTDTAVEASTLLAQFCDTEEELAEMTNTLAGVYARFPDSLPVEALVESANETARAGQIAGNLADALNWAAAEGETFGVKLKANTKENEEWNKAVEAAASAEDYFNLALQECSTQQERQRLIMETLNRIYGNAGTQYKKTNKAVIEANKANEDWNATMAEVGEELQPVVTDIKKLGTTLLKDAKEPLKDIAKFISKDLLPALVDTAKWVKKNGPLIKGTLVGVASAMVAYKVATIAAEVAQKGLTGAIKATTVAQKALNLVQKATPWGLALAGAAALTAALVAYAVATKDTSKEVSALTEEEKEMLAATEEAAQAFRDQQKATQDNMRSIQAEMDHVQSLANELKGLADASGKVKENDEARAQFILGQLNDALGTEYSMVDGVIQQYDKLKQTIDQVIQAKTVNALLEAKNAEYVQAIQDESAALEGVNLAQKEWRAQAVESANTIRDLNEERAQIEKNLKEAEQQGSQFSMVSLQARLAAIDSEIQAEEERVAGRKAAYDQSKLDYLNYHNAVMDYEEAQQAMLEGNYEKARSLLVDKGANYLHYADEVDAATRQTINSLYKEAINAGIEADRTKKNFENGVEGYTEEMVTESAKAYDDALSEWADAYNGAHAIGTDLGGGLVVGMQSTIPSLKEKARQLVNSILGAMDLAADRNSPAGKTIDFALDLGAGAEVGLEKATPDVVKAGQRQAAALIDAYDDQNVTGQDALRGVAERQAAQQVSTQMLAASSNGAMLEKILTAIEKGQVLTIDGDTLVGATAQRMDNALGQRRALAARGALK